MIVNNYKIKSGKRNVLLINPPVYSFSDFKLEYSQPTGLLRISSLLKKKGSNTTLIDCLESIDKQGIISINCQKNNFLPKYYFGMPINQIEEKISTISYKPEEIYITSFATYWYESTRDIVSLVKKHWSSATVIVGGIYPTLMPKHAEKILGADIIAVGEVEEANNQPIDLSHYNKPKYLGIKPSKGCPNNCGYCAQKAINKGRMYFQDPQEICDCIEHWYFTKCVNQIYIFSENFLVNRKHFINILTKIVNLNLKLQIGAPKGMEPRLLDKTLLELMKKAGWKGIRLALETKSERQREKLNRIYNNTADYERAIENVIDSGFDTSEIGTFLLYGTPEERIEDIIDTADYIHSFGSYIIPMAFTPVPGSHIFDKYKHILRGKELTEYMGCLYPFAEYNGYEFKDYVELEKYFSELNITNARKKECIINLNWLEDHYKGAFAKSEIAFSMSI